MYEEREEKRECVVKRTKIWVYVCVVGVCVCICDWLVYMLFLERTSSILSIILTSCVDRRICCFFECRDSTTL